MFADQGLKAQGSLVPHQPGQDHDLLAQLGIALVGHGGAADLAHVKRFFQFADLVPGQLADLVGDLAERPGDNGHGRQQLGQPVPRGVPGRQRRDQAQPGREAVEQFNTVAVERRHGAHAAEQLRDRDAVPAVPQPVAVADHLIQPHGYLGAQGGGQSLLAVGPGNGHHVPVRPGQGGKPGDDAARIPLQDGQHILYFQGLGGILDVLGGGAVMDVSTGLRGDHLLPGVEQRDQRVAGPGDIVPDGRLIKEVEPGGFRNFPGRRSGDGPQLGLAQGQGRLDVEPALEPAQIAEKPPRFHGGITAAVKTGIDDMAPGGMTGHPRSTSGSFRRCAVIPARVSSTSAAARPV